ncbi:DUF4292 domain-containing protein [Pontibacter sp. HSC-36F09]|uniref:DUF4292 domain-containing protein n=1 Tax=Pontibacter sp. HSC-36F09 TaxID=2910966 RepID=UPI00209C9330|nr:DUF4292 domain-containing protein [Pontibacter sp. HSC-36F09]MCP2043241.1 hypothetical protein [Pontibacter sp. HSC-36F09]
MNKQLLLYLLGILLFSACKKETIPSAASAATETVGNVTVQNLEFTYLNARGQLKFDDKGQSTSSGYALRMQKDSVIWISVLPGLGIEAARIKLTPDSVYMMNRIQREYAATDYAFVSKRFNVALDFQVVQAILLGNYQANGSEKATTQGQMQHVQQLRENLLFDYFISSENLKLQQLNVKDQQSGNSIVVQYESFQPLGEVPFAYNMLAQILQSGQVSDFNLSHTKVTVSEDVLEFPFSVPSGYKRL